MLLRIRVSLILAAVVLSHVACSTEQPPTCTGQTVKLVNEDVLTFGTDFAYPPFAFDHPDTGKPSGFEVELAGAIARQLGLRILLVNRNAAALIPGLLANRHDLAGSALVDGPRLRSEVCVTRPYLDANLALMARAGDPPSVAGTGDLEGRAIGVVRGGRSEAWARRSLPPTARVVRVEAPEDLVAALRSKQVDGVIDDEPLLRYQQVRADDVTVVATIETDQHYVLAAGPDNRGLVDAVNEALRRLRADGTLAALRGRWFGR